MSPTDNSDGVKEAIEAAFNEKTYRDDALYDGLLGNLPEWMPSPLKKEFKAVRNFLLDAYSEDEIREYIRARKDLFSITEVQSVAFTPPEIDDKLDALIYITTIDCLGKDKGLKAYLGEEGFEECRNIVQRDIASRKRPNALNSLIASIIHNDNTLTSPQVLRELRNKIGDGVIESIDDSKIEWTDENGKIDDTSISAIKDRVSRIKNTFLK